MKEVFIIAAKRTPIGGFLGNFAEVSATDLGAAAIKGAIENVNIDPKDIDSVYMGNVLSANLGQSPARQASKFAGIPDETDCTTVNKVCAAGMKATILGAQQIQLGLENMVITGGMESMSNVPHYTNKRKINKLGNEILIDGLLKDGLTDVYNDFHMGNAAELCVEKYKLTREQQDEYALKSYEKAAKATKEGKFKNEVIPFTLKQKQGETVITEDEDIYKIIPEKVSKLKPSFVEGGTITAANASNLNDGAAAILLASKEAVHQYDLTPLAKIVGYADAAQAPEWFTAAPSIAIPKALKRANLQLEDIDFFEINEAYAAVALANQIELGLDPQKINVYGGAVALGHPLGASGARIICTLVSVLQQEKGKYGVAAICNGGGGATAIVIENLMN
ncbi:MAG: acetyl-CoA C-acyltransferase [Chryseobacterium sp.]|jgi:acetyl-CoA C-acetyltransferase|uniref:acetyl-CoA C-acyltransferase n=1 Tax=Chryseobacterium sp. TaxID=1871047 RepID=UPI0026271529|nr:acetyl-CoA C-acyltransferase [Chryseobacterium sp.]MDF2551426.1 acetyl-CoA C-acyltransferase [Chryseobacterium sp.]